MRNKWEGVEERGSGTVGLRTGYTFSRVNIFKRECVSKCEGVKKNTEEQSEEANFRERRGRKKGRKEGREEEELGAEAAVGERSGVQQQQ